MIEIRTVIVKLFSYLTQQKNKKKAGNQNNLGLKQSCVAFFLLTNIKLPTIFGILICISRINFIPS